MCIRDSVLGAAPVKLLKILVKIKTSSLQNLFGGLKSSALHMLEIILDEQNCENLYFVNQLLMLIEKP